MLIYRLTCCIVILVALLSVLSVVAGSRCKAPVPKHFMTSACKCLTFSRKGKSNKLTIEPCDGEDQDQRIHVTKIGKTEAVFHNHLNDRFICYDVCRAKFVLVDREKLEDDPERMRLRRKLNKLQEGAEDLQSYLERERLEGEMRGVANSIRRDSSKERGGKGYRPRNRKRRGRKKGTLWSAKRIHKKLKRIYGRIRTVRKLLYGGETPTLCQQEATWIKSSTGGHHHRVRHCNNKPRSESLVCTLHEVMHGTGQNTIYAELYGGIKAIMKVKNGRIKSYKKPGSSSQTRKGEFLVNSSGNDMC